MRIENNLHIFHALASVQVGGGLHALAARSHRVFGAGDEQQGQRIGHRSRARLTGCFLRKVGKGGVPANREHLPGKGIRLVGVYHARVGAYPVVGSARILDGRGKRADHQGIHCLGAVFPTAKRADKV